MMINAHRDAWRGARCHPYDLPRIVLCLDSALASSSVCLECCGALPVGRPSLPTAALCMREDSIHASPRRVSRARGREPSPTFPGCATLLRTLPCSALYLWNGCMTITINVSGPVYINGTPCPRFRWHVGPVVLKRNTMPLEVSMSTEQQTS